MNRNIILSVVIVLIVGGIFFLESKKTDTRGNAELSESSEIKIEEIEETEKREEVPVRELNNESLEEKKAKFERAKEISTPDGFINADESFNITNLIGKKVVLLDIWTYSCINCQRTLPYLNQWHEKYSDKGLVIIGLHTPEFEFEKDIENVRRAVEKFGIEYPVVLDNDYSTWTAYENRYWPRKYLIDIDGFIVYDHIGEGGYDVTEQKIVELLNERMTALEMKGESVALNVEEPEGVQSVDFTKVRSRETYLGWGRSEYLANFPSNDCIDAPCNYVLPENVELGTYVLGGDWKIEKESAVLESDEGVIGIAFSASKVNLVVESLQGSRAEIWLDGEKIGDVDFKKADLYTLVDLEGEYGEHILEIRVKGSGFSAFAFTFG